MEKVMSKKVHSTVTVAVLLLAALTMLQCSRKATQLASKAPYVTDVSQALSKAARTGKKALLYFYSDT